MINLLFKKFIIIFVFLILTKPSLSSSLEETGMYLSEVQSSFSTKRTTWRNTVFKLRKEGKTAKGWDFDTFPEKKVRFETVVYAGHYQNMFPSLSKKNLLVIMPSYTKENQPDSIEFIWLFTTTLEKYKNVKFMDYCKNFFKKSNDRIKTEFSFLPKCHVQLNRRLNVELEISAIVFPVSQAMPFKKLP